MNGNDKSGQPLPRLPTSKRLAKTIGVYGASRQVHLLGCGNYCGHHRVLYHRLLPCRVSCRSDHRSIVSLLWSGPYPCQTTERPPHQEVRPWRVHFRLFQETMRENNFAHLSLGQGQHA